MDFWDNQLFLAPLITPSQKENAIISTVLTCPFFSLWLKVQLVTCTSDSSKVETVITDLHGEENTFQLYPTRWILKVHSLCTLDSTQCGIGDFSLFH